MTSKQALGLTMNELAEVNAEHVTTISKIEQKLTDMAVQLANAESKCRELAAENSTIKAMNDCLSEELRGYESDGAFEGPKMHLLWWKSETPATAAGIGVKGE